MTAAPLNDGQDDRLHGAQFDAASEALARHWQKLGLSRYDDDPSEEDRAPRLYAFSN
jgi:hypothetical protein